MLYIIPTPIGHLKDMSLRGIETLQNVSLILAEDTRTSGKLFKHYNIQTTVSSFHAHNEHKKLSVVIDKLVAGENIAIVSDAGTPGISDPGFLLVREAIAHNVEVTCLPGATAFVPALVMSGLPCDKFHFEGFLPQKKGVQTRLKYLAQLECTFVLYVSPHKILKRLQLLIDHCGPQRQSCLVREISKLHEEKIHGTLKEMIEIVKDRKAIKGEIVLVVAGK